MDDDATPVERPTPSSEPDPSGRRGPSLRVQVVAWLFLINALVFVSGGLWLQSAFDQAQDLRTESQEQRVRIVFDDLMSLLSETISVSSEINVQRILEDSTWLSVADAMIVDKNLAEVGGDLVHFGVALNPVGAARRGVRPVRQVLLRALSQVIESGQPVEVAGGRAIQIQNKSGVWGAFWYRMPATVLANGGTFGRLLPWFLISTLLLTGGSFLLLSRLALVPVQRLARGVRLLESGDLSARVEVASAAREFGDLMRGFNAMADEVEGFNARLAAEVRRATRQARAAEKAALTQRRLAAMGELTAGIAHEINNPLGGLLNAAHALEREDLDPERRQRYLKLLSRGLERIRDTVSGLLRFTPRETAAAPVDLLDVARDSLALVRHRAQGLGVELVLEVDGRRVRPDEDPVIPGLVVQGARNELGQALLNLLGNALDAHEDAMALGHAPPEARRITVSLSATESAEVPAMMSVSDNGPGVDADMLERVADLFFTTKEVGKGTGLGLGIVHRIVEAHGGRVQIESEPKVGFSVRLELPRGGAA